MQRVRHHARDAVDVAVAHAERAANVADRRLRAHRPEGDDLRDAVVPVLAGHVLDHLVPAVVGYVQVDVGRLLAVDVQEALEDETVGERVDERHVERVEDDAGGGGTAHAEHDLPVPAELRDVMHDEEVVREARLLDDVQLVLQPFAHAVRGERILAVQALAREVRQVLVRGLAFRDLRLGKVQAPELHLQVALLRDELRVGDGFGDLREERPHLVFRLHVVGLVVHLELAFRIVDGAVRADAQQDVVDRRVLRRRVVRVVRRDQGDVRLLRQLHEPFEHAVALGVDLGLVVPHDFEVEGVEDVAEEAGELARVLAPLLREQPVHLAGRTAAQRDDALAVLGQQLLVHARLVVEALQVGACRELDQVAVAGVILREQRQVEVVVGARVRLLEPRIGRDIRLDADDGLDVAGARFLVEVDGTVERPVVRHRDGLLAERLHPIHHVRDAAQAIEQAVLGVKVKVRKHMFECDRMVADDLVAGSGLMSRRRRNSCAIVARPRVRA